MTDGMPSAEFMLAGAARRHAENARLRQAGPVQRATLRGGGVAWLVTGFQEARKALADPRLQGRTGAVGDGRALPEAVRLGMNSHMLNTEPPDHTRLRRLISAAFTRRRLQRLRPLIRQITGGLLDTMADRAEVDLIEALATPLPIRVLTELLGVPADKVDAFRTWTETLTASAVPLEELSTAASEMLDYCGDLLAIKRHAPQSDLLSALVAVVDGRDQLTEHELTSMIVMLLIAGQETTVNLIGNATLALLTNPDELERLRARPHLMATAIEEFLRHESPVQAALRHSTAEVELGGVTVPAGAVVIVSLLGANRDPDRFVDPDTLDIGRLDSPHVAFGHGVHHCLGAPLARMEGAIALEALVRRFPALRLGAPAESLPWRVSLVMHGLARLPVRLH